MAHFAAQQYAHTAPVYEHNYAHGLGDARVMHDPQPYHSQHGHAVNHDM